MSISVLAFFVAAVAFALAAFLLRRETGSFMASLSRPEATLPAYIRRQRRLLRLLFLLLGPAWAAVTEFALRPLLPSFAFLQSDAVRLSLLLVLIAVSAVLLCVLPPRITLYLFFGGLTTLLALGSFAAVEFALRGFRGYRHWLTWPFSQAVSWILAVLFAFLTNRRYVFPPSSRSFWEELFYFTLSRLGTGLFVEYLGLYLLIEVLRVDENLSKLLISLFVVLVNYMASRFFVFRENVQGSRGGRRRDSLDCDACDGAEPIGHWSYAYRAGLERVSRLYRAAGLDSCRIPMIHIAGTNGKGSTAMMISAAMAAQGLTTVLFTSPWFDTVYESVRVFLPHKDSATGDEADAARFDACLRRLREADPQGEASQFETLTVAAILYARELGADLMVLEAGLGGKLDATNVIPPPLFAVLTSLSYDHTDVLGARLEDIVRHKAGILKKGSRGVFLQLTAGQSDAERERILRLVRSRSVEETVPLYVVDQRRVRVTLEAGNAASLSLALPEPLALSAPSASVLRGTTEEAQPGARLDGGGETLGEGRGEELYRIGNKARYEGQNAALAISVVKAACRSLHKPYSAEACARAIRAIRWRLRFEWLSASGEAKALLLLDGAHNPQALSALLDAVRCWQGGRPVRWILILGMLADKAYARFLCDLLDGLEGAAPGAGVEALVSCPTPAPGRRKAVSAQQWAALFAKPELDIMRRRVRLQAADSPSQALEMALDLRRTLASCREDCRILQCGSLYLAAAVRRAALSMGFRDTADVSLPSASDLPESAGPLSVLSGKEKESI